MIIFSNDGCAWGGYWFGLGGYFLMNSTLSKKGKDKDTLRLQITKNLRFIKTPKVEEIINVF